MRSASREWRVETVVDWGTVRGNAGVVLVDLEELLVGVTGREAYCRRRGS